MSWPTVLLQAISHITAHDYSSVNVHLTLSVSRHACAGNHYLLNLCIQYGHSGVSQQCVGRQRDISDIPTWGAAPITGLTLLTDRFTQQVKVSQGISWLSLQLNWEWEKDTKHMKEVKRAREDRSRSVGCEKWDREIRSTVWEKEGGNDTDMISA